MKLAIVSFALAAGCAGGGALAQATLLGDHTDGAGNRKPLAPLAIGASLRPEVMVTVEGAATPNLRVESVAPDVLAVEDGLLVGKSEGASAVLITTDDGAIVDLEHVWVAPVSEVSLARKDGERVTGTLGLVVGEDITLAPAMWDGVQQLAGVMDATWTASNAAPIAILRDGSVDRRRIRARAPGETTLELALGPTKTTLAIEVQP
jgi:hypothetical protein